MYTRSLIVSQVYRFYRSIQQFPTGCGRRLKLKVAKGVSGQMMLRVVARNYNTAAGEGSIDAVHACRLSGI